MNSTRLRRIVTCIGPNQKNQPNLDLYLGRRYKICHFPFVASYLCIGQNQKNQPNLVLYLVPRSKIFVSVTTLLPLYSIPLILDLGRSFRWFLSNSHNFSALPFVFPSRTKNRSVNVKRRRGRVNKLNGFVFVSRMSVD